MTDLTRSVTDKKVGGVCAGVARSLGVDVALVRIVTVVLALATPGMAVGLLYLALWAVLPEEGTGRSPLRGALGSAGGRRPNPEPRVKPRPEDLRSEPYPWERDTH